MFVFVLCEFSYLQAFKCINMCFSIDLILHLTFSPNTVLKISPSFYIFIQLIATQYSICIYPFFLMMNSLPPILSSINDIVMNIFVHAPSRTCMRISLSIYVQSQQYVYLFSQCIARYVFRRIAPIHTLISSSEELLYPTFLPTFILSSFLIFNNLLETVLYLIFYFCICLNTNEFNHLFMYFQLFCVSFCVTCLLFFFQIPFLLGFLS